MTKKGAKLATPRAQHSSSFCVERLSCHPGVSAADTQCQEAILRPPHQVITFTLKEILLLRHWTFNAAKRSFREAVRQLSVI